MAKNNTTLFIGLGVAAVLLMGKGNKKKTCPPGVRKYDLPNNTQVCETELPSLGYVQYQGQWYPQTAFQPSGQYANVQANSPQWLNILNTLIATGTSLAPYVTQLVQASQPQLSTAILAQIGCQATDLQRTRSISTANACTIKYIQVLVNGNRPVPLMPIPVNGTWDATTIAAATQVFGANVATKTLNQLIQTQGLNYIGAIQKHPNSQTRYVCNNGKYSTGGRGACSYNGGAKYHYSHSKSQSKRY